MYKLFTGPYSSVAKLTGKSCSSGLVIYSKVQLLIPFEHIRHLMMETPFSDDKEYAPLKNTDSLSFHTFASLFLWAKINSNPSSQNYPQWVRMRNSELCLRLDRQLLEGNGLFRTRSRQECGRQASQRRFA